MINKFEISVDVLSTLISISKKMKSQIVVFHKPELDYPVYMYGFYEGLMKTISDKKLECLDLPLTGIAIESKYLNELEKEMAECNDAYAIIRGVGDEFTFTKSIQYGNIEVPLLSFWPYLETFSRVTDELRCAHNIGTYGLNDNEEFLAMMDTKASDGLSLLHIGDNVVYTSPAILNVNKGDEVSIKLKKARIGNFVIFTINKPKKKCMVTVIYRALDIRKQY